MSEKVPLSPEQERQLLDTAMADIRELIKECAQGISDREAEALALAEPFEDLHDWVTDGFARARPKRPDAEGRTFFRPQHNLRLRQHQLRQPLRLRLRLRRKAGCSVGGWDQQRRKRSSLRR
jgi:hypothetical protein